MSIRLKAEIACSFFPFFFFFSVALRILLLLIFVENIFNNSLSSPFVVVIFSLFNKVLRLL